MSYQLEKPKPLHLILGEIGEELAANWLMKNGFRIWHRNWRSKYGYELDIVAFKDNKLHIVEVKTRTDDSLYEVRHALYKLDFDFIIDGITVLYHDEQHYDIEYLENINAQFIRGRFYH